MAKKKYNSIVQVKADNGEIIDCYSIDNDVNGNARYVVHFLSLGVNLNDYGKIPGLTKYRAKWFAGGYVITSCFIDEDINYAIQVVKEFYAKKGAS